MMDTESFELKVVAVVEETRDARSITLQVPAQIAGHFDYRPGQFLTLAIPSERTGVVARCYSLCSCPHDDEHLTIAVKRTADGYASNWIVDRLGVGDTVRVLPPAGAFTPADLDDDFLLFAGGSGITPVFSIVRSALSQGRGTVTLFYANRDEESVIFSRELAALIERHPGRLRVRHWLESVEGRPDERALREFAGDHRDANAFVCGPAPFMSAVMEVLRGLGFPAHRRHQEKFISLAGNPFASRHQVEVAEAELRAADQEEPGDPGEAPRDAVHLTVELDGETHEYPDWKQGQTLLTFLESKGLRPPSSCRQGECSACEYTLVTGNVSLLRNEVLDDADLADGLRLGCQSIPVSGSVSVRY
ncbi:ferredoxin--NADP reductase [Streptomyces canus]|uniref:ferredoxin--NADP reductase n=2 Tax=Streptomyces TaxID=1883 RepID=UPI002E35B153|nr:ferredoxin--NADP reductase [Streptomyces canus]